MKTRIRLAGLACLVIAVCAAGCGIPSPAQKETKTPRPGRALTLASSPVPAPDGPGRAAVVYTFRSEINLLGMEKTHPADIHRQGKVYRALVDDGLLRPDDVFVPEPLGDDQLLAVHDADYLASLRTSAAVARALEAPAVAAMPDAVCRDAVVMPFRYSAGGTLLAAELAMRHGLAINLGGGFHHAFRDHGEGFCLLADVPLAILSLRAAGRAKRAMIVDCDVHQGNGNASFFTDDPDVYVLDFYERDNYPAVKQPLTHPVPLERGITTAAYLALLREHVPAALDAFEPDVVFYLAGNDAFSGDALGHAAISADGLVQRDLYVIGQTRARGIPTVMVLAGGYSGQSWQITYRTVAQLLGGRDPGMAAPPAKLLPGKTKGKIGGQFRPDSLATYAKGVTSHGHSRRYD